MPEANLAALSLVQRQQNMQSTRLGVGERIRLI